MATSVSSNLNVDSIVSALMQPYQQKISKVASDISSYQVKISDLSKLKSSLTTLQTDLKSVEANEKTALTPEKLKANLQSFVKDFNSAVSVTRKSSDMSINRLTQKLRSEIDPTLARSIGLSFDKTGLVVFDETKFDALNTNDNAALNTAVNNIFDKALASGSNLDSILKDGGSLDISNDTYNKKITELNLKKDKMTDQLGGYEAAYRRQFNALQKSLSVLDGNQEIVANLIKTSA
jgi:flagellar capping protein FliD